MEEAGRRDLGNFPKQARRSGCPSLLQTRYCTYITHLLNLTPVGEVYVMAAVPGVSAQARPVWLTYITSGLLEAQVPVAPA